jgi:protein-disulfide isomerase
MMVFGDFQCPFSSRLVKTLKLLVKDQPRKVKVVWRDFPLAFHKEAKPAAVVGQEVFLQKGSSAFWAFTELVFANPRGLSEAALLTFAGQVGAEVAKVRLALGQAQGRASKAVERDMKDGAAAGVKGTPASFLFRDGTPLRNAKQLPGARQYPDLKAEVDGI